MKYLMMVAALGLLPSLAFAQAQSPDVGALNSNLSSAMVSLDHINRDMAQQRSNDAMLQKYWADYAQGDIDRANALKNYWANYVKGTAEHK
jgi:hypothetical protein